MSWFNNLGIRAKLVSIFLIVAVIPIITLGLIARSQTSNELESDARATVADLAFNASDKLDRNLFERYGDVQAYARSESARSMEPGRVTDWIDTMMGIYTPIYELMVVADAEGKIIAVNSVDLNGNPLGTESLLGTDVSRADWFVAATNGSLGESETFVQDLHADALMGRIFGSGANSYAMSYTFPIHDDAGEVIGVWTNRVNWDVTYDILDAVLVRAREAGLGTAALTIVSDRGVVLASADPTETLQRDLSGIAIVQSAITRGASGDAVANDLSTDPKSAVAGYFNSAGFETYPGVGWGFIATQDKGEALAAVGDFTRSVFIVGLVIAAIAAAAAFGVAELFRRPAVAVQKSLESLESGGVADLESGIGALAEGNLTVEVASTTPRIANPSNDEVGRSAQAVNSILDRIESTIEKYNQSRQGLGGLVRSVQTNASSITAASEQLGEASGQMATATGQIASAISEVTTSAVSLTTTAQDSAREVEQVAAGSQQLTASAQSNADAAAESRNEATQMGERIALVATASGRVAASAEESRTAALEGQQAVNQAVESMQAIAGAVGRASGTVNQLGDYGEQIGNIVQTIDEIAAQTALLALNAAIEAARAGEQGRGFAVVADNVRTLAERSSNATKEIADLIAKVQSGTKDAVDAMEAGVKDVEGGREITAQAGVALDSIIASVQGSAEQMQGIASDVQDLAQGAERIIQSAEGMASIARESASGADEMARGTQKVNEAILQVSTTSEETSASAEEVSASTEELSAQAQELSATANQMQELATALDDAAGSFTL